ncbi:ferrous iron transport protein A [Roseibium sp. Sym1]|uniref:ferrous iron transport protein A n=1 Tax=Roseibium sp. Sym1 TaxID=3016006 RepID=UPI0022B48278|nr:ferrous iron transport protein A [Roseibium sp. Sym1]
MPQSAFDVTTKVCGEPEPRSVPGDTVLTLAAAEPGRPYHVASLGETRHATLDLLSAGLAPDIVVRLLRGEGSRPRIVACGEIRTAIGADLAAGVVLKPCGCGCGCDPLGEEG